MDHQENAELGSDQIQGIMRSRQQCRRRLNADQGQWITRSQTRNADRADRGGERGWTAGSPKCLCCTLPVSQDAGACLPLRLSTNNTDQAQERSCKTSLLRIALGQTKALLVTDNAFCLEWQKKSCRQMAGRTVMPDLHLNAVEISDAQKSKGN